MKRDVQQDDIAKLVAPPPALFFICLGLGYALDKLFPLEVIASFGNAKIIICCSLFMVFFIMTIWSFWTLRRHGTPVDPNKPTVHIVDSGPYRFSRNPLYIALLFLFVAFSVLMNSIWMFVLIPVLFCFLHYGVVLREEEYLAGKFHERYHVYCRRVRRWL